MNVSFYCRASKADRNGLSPIEVSIIINGKRVYIATQRKEKSEDFAKATSTNRDNDIKRFIQAMRANINKSATEIVENGEALTAEMLKMYIRTGGIRKYTVEDMFNEFMALQTKRVGISCGKLHYRKYEIVRDAFYEFFDRNKPVTAINSAVVEDFSATLGQKYAPATITGMMTKFKCVIEYAFRSGKIKSDPFAAFRIDKQKPKQEWLSDEELQKIRDLDLPFESLRNARTLFLFQCATGISYADLANLKREDIIEKNGVYSVTKTRCKTGIPFTSVILPEGVQILKDCDFKLKVISNQKYNFYLLQIQQLAGISKRIHSHLGRKVYGSLLLRNGCCMKTVSRALGHSSTQITESTYAFLQSDDIINEISAKMCSASASDLNLS